MAIEESLVVKGVLEGLKSGTKDGYITTLERFVNEFATDMTINTLSLFSIGSSKSHKS